MFLYITSSVSFLYVKIRNNVDCRAVCSLLETTLDGKEGWESADSEYSKTSVLSQRWNCKEESDIQFVLLFCYVCFLVNNQFLNKEEKMLLLLSDRSEVPAVCKGQLGLQSHVLSWKQVSCTSGSYLVGLATG